MAIQISANINTSVVELLDCTIDIFVDIYNSTSNYVDRCNEAHQKAVDEIQNARK